MFYRNCLGRYLKAYETKNLVIAAHQASTVDMWKQIDKFDVFILDMVIQESSRGDKKQSCDRLNKLTNIPALKIDDEAK